MAANIWTRGLKAAVKTGPFFFTHHDNPTKHKPDPIIPCIPSITCAVFWLEEEEKAYSDYIAVAHAEGNTYSIKDCYNFHIPFENPDGKIPTGDQTQDGWLNGPEEGHDGSAWILAGISLAYVCLNKKPWRPQDGSYCQSNCSKGPSLSSSGRVHLLNTIHGWCCRLNVWMAEQRHSSVQGQHHSPGNTHQGANYFGSSTAAFYVHIL